MKKIYCKPSITTVKINSSSFICTSLEVKSESYDATTMKDLSRGSRFSRWEDIDEEE